MTALLNKDFVFIVRLSLLIAICLNNSNIYLFNVSKSLNKEYSDVQFN